MYIKILLKAKRNDISVSLVSKMYENDTHQYNINVQENSFKIGKYFITGSNYVLGSEDEITIKINDCINFIEVIIAQNEKPDFKSAIKCLTMFLCFVITSSIIILAIIYIIFTLTFTRNS
ncbi:hypothetical protein H8356DRAFT_947642 [Neocallimastix lanati (nom. inval.)]|nr:hypothetical protein H8356DRAFT_947642 [Neocallimastix sp. JGI-2020a]